MRRGLRAGAVALGLAAALARPALAAPARQTATPTPPPTPPVAVPDLAGSWSITRTWYRSCPRCGHPVVRTTPWEVEQAGAALRIDRGLEGTVWVGPSGEVFLDLGGSETGGYDVLRFWYGTLRVSPDGNRIEGGFGGSERIGGACGEPATTTCFVDAGWLRGQRVHAAATRTPTATAPPLPSPAPPTDTPPPVPPLARTEVPTATAAAPPTPTRPAEGRARLFLPHLAR
jgi:hypothetical protein